MPDFAPRRQLRPTAPRRTPRDFLCAETTEDRKAAKNFYKSPAWRALRLAHLRRHPLCADCQKAGITTAAAHVHHILERRAHPLRALDPSNLESLCQPCHNTRKTAY